LVAKLVYGDSHFTAICDPVASGKVNL